MRYKKNISHKPESGINCSREVALMTDLVGIVPKHNCTQKEAVSAVVCSMVHVYGRTL